MNPVLLPKVRSDLLKHSCRGMGCRLRIASFVGKPCSPGAEAVHLDGLAPALGKGTSTKVSDLNMVAGCRVCHDLLARLDPAWQKLVDLHPAAVQKQIHRAHMETLALWLQAEALIVPDGRMI